MSQNRKPPAYQEYAASMLAKMEFRAMTLEERGLLYTARLECWENNKLPSGAEQLSDVLGKPINSELLKSIEPFFTFNDNGISSPELDSYRAYLDEIKEKQSRGGKKGAKTTNSRVKTAAVTQINSRVTRRASRDSLVQSSPDKQSQKQYTEGSESYLDKNGVDPLDEELRTPASECTRCSGEGCGWCDG